MSKSISGLFHGTFGSSHLNDSIPSETYSERGIEIPEHIRNMLSSLKKKGDYIVGKKESFSIKDISIMSKEAGIEFAHVTIGDKAYVIRGDQKGTDLSPELMKQMKRYKGTLDYHSHPYDNDCLPSYDDRRALAELQKMTGQRESKIVTPNGRVVTFDKGGTVSVTTVPNSIDENLKKAYLDLWR